MKDTPYRLFALISGMLFLTMLLIVIGSLFPETGIISRINSLPDSLVLTMVLFLLIITSILSIQGAERVSRKAGLRKYWNASFSGAPPWMITGLKAVFACMILAVIIHVIQLSTGNTGSEKFTTLLFMSLVGMAFTGVNTALLFSLANIADANPPSPERLRFMPREDGKILAIQESTYYRKKARKAILNLLIPAALIVIIMLGQICLRGNSPFTASGFYLRLAAFILIMAVMFALVYLALLFVYRYRLSCNTEELRQVRFGITRRVRWDRIRLVEYQEKRYHDRSGWSPAVIWIHGKPGAAIVVTGDMERFKDFEKLLDRQLESIYGVSYKDIREEGWWGERSNWFLSAGIETLRFITAAGIYLALILGIVFAAGTILQYLGLPL